ncbi:hypothetical protein PP935_gp124 [Rhizobium phage RHph_N34]|uniref:Uncharacterized protein n=1 Tax=Rhizobium phage RHph_N34 TaxID=2509586 RepID=A0A7S5UYG9_9CAUD|nr:hypothetical protein PP935_gp124 [Rhizobium phage RHph_N34]QIG73899.1 hypothetical protein EVC06_124 [Rhizobium phage RHph_N34]
MKQYLVTILLPSGRTTRTIIYADSVSAAREIAEIHFGARSVTTSPVEVAL